MPRELGGSNGRGTNSEQLFAAAYTSYFLGMLRLVAAREGIALPPDAVIRHSRGTPDLFAAAAALRGRRASEEGARPERHAITSLLGRSSPEGGVDAQSPAR
jgi:organic hydroperoxide reductase OsmC/OhrA